MEPSPPGRRRVIRAAGAAAGLLALASAWPALGQGQAPPVPRVLRIAFLGLNRTPDETRELAAALASHGWVEGRNLVIESRWADGNLERLPVLAAELVQNKVDLILVYATPDARAAQQATSTIPILLFGTGGDPVASGLVKNLSRPGGNITGLSSMTAEQGVKRLELLKELLPRVSKVALLISTQTTDATRRALNAAAAALRIELVEIVVNSDVEIRAAVAGMRHKGVQALTLTSGPLLRTRAKLLAELALEQRLPFAGLDLHAEEGALLGFNSDNSFIVPRGAIYIDRIARGAKPGEMPIERPTRFNLAVNLKTARLLGVKIPPSFLAKVDRVIE